MRIEKDFNELHVVARPHGVVFYCENPNVALSKDMVTELIDLGKVAWKNIIPKEADSWGSDYWEYYDTKYDNNGYLDIVQNAGLKFGRPNENDDKVYQFNKAKWQSFVYDMQKAYEEG